MPPETTRPTLRDFDFEAPIVELEKKIVELKALAASHPELSLQDDIQRLQDTSERLAKNIFDGLTAWQRIQMARCQARPQAREYLEGMFTDWVALSGDRTFAEDKAMITAFASLDGRQVLFVGQNKGKDATERRLCNFGMSHPEGYRKALRTMKLAEKFNLPILCFIDTMGAFPGVGAEERGQALAIARNVMEMARIDVPIICTVIGEGGSGGALGIGVGDRILMLEHAYYSVITPEGCSSILWRGPDKKEAAAAALKPTAKDLLAFGIIDEIVPEPFRGAHRDPLQMFRTLKSTLTRHLDELRTTDPEHRLATRYRKFRKLGVFQETATEPSRI